MQQIQEAAEQLRNMGLGLWPLHPAVGGIHRDLGSTTAVNVF